MGWGETQPEVDARVKARQPLKGSDLRPRETSTTKALNALERLEEICNEAGQDVKDLVQDIRNEIEGE